MRSRLRMLLYPLAAIIGCLVTQQGCAAADPEPQPNGSRLPVLTYDDHDKDREGYYIQKTDVEFVDYMWRSFIALMWPSGNGVTWETHISPSDVFVPSGENRGNWSSLPIEGGSAPPEDCPWLSDTVQPVPEDPDFITLRAVNLPSNDAKRPVGPLLDHYSQDAADAHYVRAQVKMNTRFADYVVENGYYNALTQAGDVTSGTFKALPYDGEQGQDEVGMIETKAAWMVLAGPKWKDRDRYYRRYARLIPSKEGACSKALVGLVAFHIHRLNKMSHTAATFEQVDNVQAPAGIIPSFNIDGGDYGPKGYSNGVPPVIELAKVNRLTLPEEISNISRATPILPSVLAGNRKYQEEVKGTPTSVLQHYQLIGVQHAAGFCRMKIEDGKKVWKPSKAEVTVNYKDGRQVAVTKGCPTPDVDDLINVALEPNTQRFNPQTQQAELFSCQGCHSYARPCCTPVTDLDHEVMSYLLSKAWFPGQTTREEFYSCSAPDDAALCPQTP